MNDGSLAVTADPFAVLATAYRSADQVARQRRAAGERVVRTLGPNIPFEILIAAGLSPVRLAADPEMPTPAANALVGSSDMNWRGRSLLEQILSTDSDDPIVIAHVDELHAQLFAALRELSRHGDLRNRPIHFFDRLPGTSEAIVSYNLARIEQLRLWASDVGAKSPNRDSFAGAIESAIETTSRQRRMLAELGRLRTEPTPLLTGTRMLHAIGAATIMPIETHLAAVAQAIADAERSRGAESSQVSGERVFLTGSPHETDHYYRLFESCGLVIVGEDHDWGDPWYAEQFAGTADPLNTFATERRLAAVLPLEHRARIAASRAVQLGVETVIHLTIDGDESSPWDAKPLEEELGRSGIRLLKLRVKPGDSASEEAVRNALRSRGEPTSRPSASSASAPAKPAVAAKPRDRGEPGQRSRKSLRSVADFGTYQREWFAGVRRRTQAGEPFAVLNANGAQEIFRAFDIPFVVNQWWASIVAAKQQSRRYAGLLRENGYPTNVEAYSSQGIAAAFETDEANAPWGGLPRPTILAAITSSDPTRRIFQSWARETGAELFLFERSVDTRWDDLPNEWWDILVDRWDAALESERLDLLTAEFRNAIAAIEKLTGRTFDPERFETVMNLVNEQENHYREARDLIARTIPAPASIVDTMPATMVPQWHRGTEWGRDAAKALNEEIAARAAAGEAACPGERIRLMWVGRGLWSDMAFYQRWEESHGAVFVWSMYLALAADGYLRYCDRGQDPMRALAARFVTMGDELRMPTWAGEWHVKEALTHSIDGAVAVSDADPFVIRALERAGIPVLALGLDNFNQADDGMASAVGRLTAFIEGPVADRARARAGG